MTPVAGRAKLVLGAALLSACGGGAPLLHAAHTLPAGDTTFTAGSSGHFSGGDLARAEGDLDRTAATPGGATTPQARARFVAGALSRLAIARGVAPFVAARVGLGHQNEVGLTYTGRSARLDARHAFEWPSLALSVGAAASCALARPGDQPAADVRDEGTPITGLRLVSLTSLTGYGLELPLLAGYRSSADVVKLWTGLRAGFERSGFDVALTQAPDLALGSSGKVTRVWGGGLIGFSVGLAPIEVLVEVDGAYQKARGQLLVPGGEVTGEVDGWTLTPAMAISAKF